MKIKITKKDREFSAAIKSRDRYRCRSCGKHYPPTSLKNKCALGVMHFFGRRDPALRYNDRNAMAACTACHAWLGANPHWMVRFWEREIGTTAYTNLASQCFMYGMPRGAMRGLRVKPPKEEDCG